MTLILLQALTLKKCLFNSSLQSGRNVVSQLTLTYSLIAVVSFETNIVFCVSSFCTNCLRSLIISFQNANRKWSETRFFIHPSVKQNVPEWHRLIKSQICFDYSFLRWGLKSFSCSVPVSPFLFHWKLVLKLNVAFSYLVSVVDTRFMRAIQSSMRNSHQYLAFIQSKKKTL